MREKNNNLRSHSYALREEINVALGHVNPAIVASDMAMGWVWDQPSSYPLFITFFF